MSGERPRITIAEVVSEPAMARLREAGEIVRLDSCDEATLIEEVTRTDALVVRTYAEVTAKVIAAAKAAERLKVIGRAGVGVDNIDVRAAHQAGIPVVHTPAACTVAVAELVVGFVIALQRGIVRNDDGLRQGRFAEARAGVPTVIELQHQTLGIIGMGRIGRAVGDRLHNGLRMRVVYHDIREVGWLPFPAESRSTAQAVYAEADVISMHVPLTDKTRHMINTASLKMFKPGSYLINASRGPVVDGLALADALAAGQLGGAAIDVFEPEPPTTDHPLMSAPNCIVSPHVASRTYEGITAMNDVVDDVIGVLRGEPPRWPADPNVL